ncbi:MAG: hypothetical protein OEM02_16925 [Desulfobulbaceae bacterium]|nr:hypothetical protein [Desulfobulbaceae bacterium]
MDDMSRDSERLDKGWLIILVIWGAVLSSLVVYVVVCYLVKIPGGTMTIPAPKVENIKYILLGLSIVELFVIRFVRNLLIKVRPSEVVTDFDSVQQHPAVVKYFAATLVSTALAESIAIFGIVIFFMSGDMASLYLFVTLSAAAMIYFRPRKEELYAIAEQMRS